jgi:DNA gyrase subunit A
MKLIAELEAILKSEKKMMAVIRGEVVEIRDNYGEDRRTKIVKAGIKEFRIEDVIPDSETIVMMTKDGYIKRVAPETFKAQARGGKGVAGLATKEEDVVETVFSTSTHQDLYFFTTRGRVFKLKAYELPEASRTAKGQAIVNFLQLAPGEKVTAFMSSSDLAGKKYIVMVTTSGTIKKVEIKEFDNVRRSGIIAIKLGDGDSLEWVRATHGEENIILVTAQAMSIHFSEKDIRAMGRTAAGVRGIKLKGQDYIVGLGTVNKEDIKKGAMLLVATQNGYGKRTEVVEYTLQKRGGSGIRTGKVTDKTGKVVTAQVIQKDDVRTILAMSSAGQAIRFPLASVSLLGRATQGVRIMRFKKPGDEVSSLTLVGGEEEEEKKKILEGNLE